jgi:hypothetical protein
MHQPNPNLIVIVSICPSKKKNHPAMFKETGAPRYSRLFPKNWDANPRPFKENHPPFSFQNLHRHWATPHPLKMTTTTISALRESLCAETTLLPVRFRALFSLKHIARQSTGPESQAAIDAIAAAFASPSALLKHELAYCLGQTGNGAAIAPLTAVLEDVSEDPMCRHEAAEALGALGHAQSTAVLERFRDRDGEDVVVRETCEIALDRIAWENSEERKKEKLKQRWVLRGVGWCLHCGLLNNGLCTVTLRPSIRRRPRQRAASRLRSWRRIS